ncbi:MAG: ATPase RavA [Candidatus Woesearchaeota archaeon]|nr:ATPase RavA [Candidatus Woesearchaeota archaeon]
MSGEQEEFEEKLQKYKKKFVVIKKEIGKVMIGQKDIINSFLTAMISNGHVLVEGVPGIGKTVLVNTLSKIIGAKFSRIQFTPDLLPSDIVGLTSYQRDEGFYTIKGPIFSNIVLADEINRAPPKVQSALLEAMAERQATIGKETFPIPPPFFVLATQNPIEQAGTYPLPEAQIDRFIFKLVMTYPSVDEEIKILKKNTMLKKMKEYNLKELVSPDEIIEMQQEVKKVYLDEKLEKYIVNIIDATRHPKKYKLKLGGKYIDFGASPRGSIGMSIASRAVAFIEGQAFVTPHHVKSVAKHVLRHRILLNYVGQAESVSTDTIVEEILETIPVP